MSFIRQQPGTMNQGRTANNNRICEILWAEHWVGLGEVWLYGRYGNWNRTGDRDSDGDSYVQLVKK